MAAAGPSSSDMLLKLEQVRQACLADAAQYISVVPGVVPILQGAQAVDVRRWGAEFMAEAFATPALQDHQKEQMVSETVMALLRGMLDNPSEDAAVVKSTVQASASIYPHVFRKVLSHPDLGVVWRDMTSIKITILQRMDAAPLSIRVCCIKFLQKVVQVQTPGQIADPRKPEHNETSIALVPRTHALLSLANLEAETSGILDRLLSVIQENSTDPLLIDPTMNCLAVLLKTRPAIQAKILQTLLNYNPFRAAAEPLTPRSLVVMKSLQRTTRALLRWVMRALTHHPLLEKVDAYLRRLQSTSTAVFSQAQSLKRSADGDGTGENAKRQKLEPARKYPSMPPPPNTYAQLFTLIDNQEFQQFDVKILPEEVVCLISSALMQHIDSKSLDEAVEVVQMRLQKLQDAAKTTAAADDDDEYDPEAMAASDNVGPFLTQQDGEILPQPMLELGTFELPKPSPLSEAELAMLSEQTIAHVFETALSAAPISALAKQKAGMNRLAGSTNDRESWLTVMIRLATRAPAGLDSLAETAALGDFEHAKSESKPAIDHRGMNMPNRIRQLLFDYIIDDWKHRLPLAITWLTEEWYADKVQSVGTTNGHAPTVEANTRTPNYDDWTSRLFETLVPRFDKDDHRFLIRFLSELPALNSQILSLVKPLTRDPATVNICKQALLYLIMMRPPVRKLALDVTQEIWEEGDEDVKSAIGSVLSKWNPGFVEKAVEKKKDETEGKGTRTYPNGVKAEDVGNGETGIAVSKVSLKAG